MAKVILKKSSVAGKIPLATDLDYGELAINYTDGKLFYKTSSNSVAEFSGGGAGGSIGTLAVRRAYEFTATSGQTSFTVPLGYVAGNVEVALNGSVLSNSDYTATNGTTVVLAEAAVANDLVQVIVLDSRDSYTKTESDTTTTSLTNHAIAMAIALG
jgi:hypothetical protein